MLRRIASSDRKRKFGDIAGNDACRSSLSRERDGEASAAGADVGEGEWSVGRRKQRQRRLDDQLGFWAWNQHRRRDLERQTPELPPTHDVGEWLAVRAPRNERVVSTGDVVPYPLVGGREEALGRPSQRELGEQPRVEIRFVRRNAGRAQPAARLGDVLVDGFRRQRWRL
jgi:hypothetical protein